MNQESTASNWADYTAAVSRFSAAIDRILARGREACHRHDSLQLRQQRFVEAGIAPADASQLPAGHRHIHDRLTALTESLFEPHDRSAARRPDSPSSLTPTAARALGARTRI